MPQCTETNRNGTPCRRPTTYRLTVDRWACQAHLAAALFDLVPPDPSPIPDDAPTVVRDGVPCRVREYDTADWHVVEYEPVDASA